MSATASSSDSSSNASLTTSALGSTTATTRSGNPWFQLTLATIGFAVNFWAWALLSPLGPLFRANGTLGDITEGQVSLLVAVPVIVGSIGRIFIGGLTDKYGGRLMFPLVTGATIIPVLLIGFWAQGSLAAILVMGFFLGIAGTSFAIGVPFVNAWFPPAKRGLAIGIFGAGMGGTAISALTTVPMYENIGDTAPFVICAIVLAVYGVFAWFFMRDAPGRVAPTTSLMSRIVANSKLPITWQASILYAVAFGGYVAFSVYLPVYLRNAYGLEPADASNRMAGFVLIAVIGRPLGGWLADRLGSIRVLGAVFAVVAVCAAIASSNPPLENFGTIVFLLLALALGVGSGAVFALIAQATEPSRVGGVTGIVGAAGGLGGFVPPLIMGAIYGLTSSYQWGLWLLAITSALTLLLTLTVVRKTRARVDAAPH
ncbi:nitrate/nitrite transporter [Cumulibacter soli]|uniref:nitrate/nitrite transporter n=1 Tax=Cumulibacter soli TaxID=2546344 RepID=UPI00106818E3|nr:MFS transporter [Cumulibacter soli]